MTALLVFLLFSQPVSLQNQYKAHIRLLADDLMEGRETGMRGQKLAAAYIASQFAALGVTPIAPGSDNPYYQTFDLDSSRVEIQGLSAHRGGKTVDVPAQDVVVMSRGNGDTHLMGDAVFVGYGIQTDAYDDFAGMDVKDKWVVVLDGKPKLGTLELPENALNRYVRYKNATKAGVKGVILLASKLDPSHVSADLSLSGSSKSIRPYRAYVKLAPHQHQAVFGDTLDQIQVARKTIEDEGKPASFAIKDLMFELRAERKLSTLSTENVIGILPGSDAKLKNEYLVLTAHYDHEGISDGVVYNGADDNASGTATLLLLADYLRSQKHRRSIILMLMTGEEKGLLGSEYFVAHPIVPLEQIVADINVDMIGRSQDGRFGLIPSEGKDVTTLNATAIKLNQKAKLGMTFREDMDEYHTRSDHYNFTEAGVPALFFFTGVHEDYHQPTDDWDKLHYDEMAKFFTFFNQLVLTVSNDTKRPQFIAKDR